jgi:hypothetical protein
MALLSAPHQPPDGFVPSDQEGLNGHNGRTEDAGHFRWNPVKRQPFTLGNSAAPDMVDLDADLSVLS